MVWSNLSSLCDIIILVAGVLVAIKTISEWFGKPISFVRKKVDTNFEERVVAVLDKVLPEKFNQHDLATRDRYRADRETYLQEIKTEVLRNIQGELGQIADLTEQYAALAISAKDVLREKIMAIYHKNKTDRTMTYHEKEALDVYYKDYKKIKGNSYIDKYYARMSLWKIVDDDYDDSI